MGERFSDVTAVAPVVLQVGGFRPNEMCAAAKLAYNRGYRMLNINSGCPSPVVAGCRSSF
jgi:tRNA-dihydrouridine synthase